MTLTAPAATLIPAETGFTVEPTTPAVRPATTADTTTVPPDQRDQVLPEGWRTSGDLMWTTAGDSSGFHLLVADSTTGYTWRTVATLAEPGMEADRWIGNACLTASGKRAVMVYAPRHFTNRQVAFDRGGFVAVVSLADGRVTKLGVRASLAHYNPGCGADETAVLTQSGAVDLGRTRLHFLDTTKGSTAWHQELTGQVTSAVPFGAGFVAAAGDGLVAVDARGGRRVLARTNGTPFSIRTDRLGGITFLERQGDLSFVKYLIQNGKGSTRELARGRLTELGLAAGGDGQVFVTGKPTWVAKNLPGTVRHTAVPLGADVSTHGAVALTHGDLSRVNAFSLPTSPTMPMPVHLMARVLATGKELPFQVMPGTRMADKAGQGRAMSPALDIAGPTGGPRVAAPGSPTDPIDADRSCSVPRNDARTQVEQPHWRQVEWAADLAVKGALTFQRPANWKQSGLPAWSPQLMYPRVGLIAPTPNATVPASILLGILAQESNLWQASWHALEGVTGNPLVGNFYGLDIYNADPNDDWTIRWSEADCGYGVAQVTDYMRLGDPRRTPTQQRAIAVDYATNIAAALRILEQKWNQTYTAGIRMNNADPARIENWFAAVWAYNTGVNPQESTGNTSGCTPSPSCADSRGNWGLGWTNNPANPDYPANRTPFLDNDPDDARHPQHWPYPEKVIGWAAYPIIKHDFRTGQSTPGYAQAWWINSDYRTLAKPPLEAFCSNASDGNHCDINRPGNPCLEGDFHCWWHLPVTWKEGCDVQTCGFDESTFNPGEPEPPGGTHYPPVCHRNGLPAGALVVDNLREDVGIVRPGCENDLFNEGEFTLAFGSDGTGKYPSKVDFHQIGSGVDGHFYFAHTWNSSSNNNKFQVTGTWTLSRNWQNVWARVLVHLPGHGAHTQQAAYVVDTGANAPTPRLRTRHVNTASRYIDQNNRGDRWVSLGVFSFYGTPKVSLSNLNSEGNGTHDIAFDAVAFELMNAKPQHFVTVMGDSYSSGEGASTDYLHDYYRETDNGDPGNRNGCHRSRHAWSRLAALADKPSESIGSRADGFDRTLDYHSVACSQAETENLLPPSTKNAWNQFGRGMHRQLSQIDQGYLDENTTLVALSIGGNDLRWDQVLMACATNPMDEVCRDRTLPGDPLPLKDMIPSDIRQKAIPSIETVLNKIHERAPLAKIVLMGYPHLMHPDMWCLGFPFSLSPSEVAFFDEMADLFAEQMRELTLRLDDRYQVVFSDPRTRFSGKEACGSPEAIHAIILAQTPGEDPEQPVSQQSFHPNMTGVQIYKGAFEDTLRTIGL